MRTLPLTVEPVCLALHAMRCRFEFVLFGENAADLRGAGEEALREVQALDRRLNVFAPDSELARLNREAADGPTRVSPCLFEAIRIARDLAIRTRGAFDPTLGPLVRLWREAARTGSLPAPESLSRVRESLGFHHLQLDPEARSVRFTHPTVGLNLNALAKGLALDAAASILREAGIESALLHGGTSSVLAIGTPPDAAAWSVGVADPETPDRIAHRLELKDCALGVSSQNLQKGNGDGNLEGHVLSPLLGEPVHGSHSTAVLAPSAAVADALSTALLASPPASVDWLLPGEEGLMLVPEADGTRITRFSPPSAANAIFTG